MDIEPTGRRYDSVEAMLRGEKVDPEVIHMFLEMAARDRGTNNPQTDQRIDTMAVKEVEKDGQAQQA